MRRTGSRGERTRLRPAIRARVLRWARCDNFEETPMRIRAAVLESDRPSAALCRDAAARRRRSSTSRRPAAARSWCESRRRACAIPTSPSSTAPAPGPCRWRSGTRRRASSRRLARGSPTSRSAITSCWCSCRVAGAAALAPRGVPRSASPARRPTGRARCFPASAGSRSRPSRSTITSASRPSRPTRWSRTNPASGSTGASARAARRCSAARVLTGVGAVDQHGEGRARRFGRRRRPRRRGV